MHPTLSLGIHPFVDRSFHPLQKIEFAGGFDYPALWHLDAARGPSTPSLDHLVGAAEQREREGETKRLGGLQIDDKIESGRLLDRKVGRALGLGTAAAVYPPVQGCSARFRPIQNNSDLAQGPPRLLWRMVHPKTSAICAGGCRHGGGKNKKIDAPLRQT